MMGRNNDFSSIVVSSFLFDNEEHSDNECSTEFEFCEMFANSTENKCQNVNNVNDVPRSLYSGSPGVNTGASSKTKSSDTRKFNRHAGIDEACGRYKNALPSDIEPDGRIVERQKDPPGQNSTYILPGDESKETYRLSTFIKYPENVPIEVCRLAAHGFLYTGYKDRVKCFSCGSNVQSWSIGDDPASAQWHFCGCELVLEIDQRNQPLGNRRVKFVGTFQTPRSCASTSTPKRVVQGGSLIQCDELNFAQTSSSSADEMLSQTLSVIQIGNNKNVSINAGSSSNQSSSFQTAHFHSVNKNFVLQYPVKDLLVAKIESPVHKELLKSLDLHKEQDRRKSFTNWSLNFVMVTPLQLAECGFFYLGNSGKVQCFSCSIVICDWLSSDTVEEKHRIISPSCRMVLKTEPRNIPMMKPVQASVVVEPPDPTPVEAENLQTLFPCLNPVNPHMRRLRDREQTFDSRWPKHKVLASAKHIAKAGFYFLGQKDRAKCHYCNGGLQNWDPKDEPFTEHAKWFPGCEYILRCKGVEFVKDVVAKNPNLNRPQLRNPRFNVVSGQVLPLLSLPEQPSIVDTRNSAGSVLARFSPSPPNSNAGNENSDSIPGISDSIVSIVRSMGFVDEQIKRVAERRLRVVGRNFENCQDLIDELLSNDEPVVQDFPPADAASSRDFPPVDVARSSSESPESLKRNNNEPTVGEPNTSGGVPSKKPKPGTDGNNEVNGMHQALSNLEYERNCKRCHQNVADTVVIPCGHLSLCGNCAEQGVKRCPICKWRVQEVIKAFLA